MLNLWSIRSVNLGREGAFEDVAACLDRFRTGCMLAECELPEH